MNQNNEIREEFIKYIENNGIKIKFVADKIGVTYSTFSKWKQGKFDFGSERLIEIKNYLKENNK